MQVGTSIVDTKEYVELLKTEQKMKDQESGFNTEKLVYEKEIQTYKQIIAVLLSTRPSHVSLPEALAKYGLELIPPHPTPARLNYSHIQYRIIEPRNF